jgi:prevent-host-death family protein
VSGSVSVRELCNSVSAVLRRVEGGERLTITADGRPVAELLPLRRRGPVPVDEARRIAGHHPADAGLLGDLARVLPDTTDDA